MTENETQVPEPGDSCAATCSHRSVTFWYSDTADAGEKMVQAAMQYAPGERENFLNDAFLAAKVQLIDANDQGLPSAGGAPPKTEKGN